LRTSQGVPGTSGATGILLKTPVEPRGSNLVATAQLVLGKFCTDRERLHEEAEKEIAEESRHLDNIRVSYQTLLTNLWNSKLKAKSLEDVIASVREIIAKAQALIQDNEQVLVQK